MNIPTVLEYLYFIVYYGNRSKDSDDKRFNPAAMIVLIASPAINSIFGLFAGPVGHRTPLSSNSQVLYARYDIWTYVSIALAAIIAWQEFDKKREGIIRRYGTFKPTTNVYWLSVSAAVLFILSCSYLSTISSVASVTFTLAALYFGRIMATRAVSLGRPAD
jgi:hypothetical protein